jgi:hypothetical protein
MDQPGEGENKGGGCANRDENAQLLQRHEAVQKSVKQMSPVVK